MMVNANSSSFLRVAGLCAYAGAVISAFGIVFLLAFYVGFLTDNVGLQRFGTLNDICIIIQYLLALPVVVALHQILSPHFPRLSRAAAFIGLCGIIVVVFFQVLLVAGVMEFSEQVVFATLGLLIIGVWIVITSSRLRAIGVLRKGVLVGILGFFYLGYPVWVFVIGRRLLAGTREAPSYDESLQGETT
jgi:hypothetical protein